VLTEAPAVRNRKERKVLQRKVCSKSRPWRLEYWPTMTAAKGTHVCCNNKRLPLGIARVSGLASEVPENFRLVSASHVKQKLLARSPKKKEDDRNYSPTGNRYIAVS
jgi:hypothetical protein